MTTRKKLDAIEIRKSLSGVLQLMDMQRQLVCSALNILPNDTHSTGKSSRARKNIKGGEKD